MEKIKSKSTLTKNKSVEVETKKGGSYTYRYTELADINDYIDSIGERYYQFIERIDNDDYIMTVRQKNDIDSNPIRGCRIVQATINNDYSNPAQEQGSALTYARRYSLLMAYGLATEDDDANSLNKLKEQEINTKEEASNYVITFGKKHKGETLGEILKDDPSYIDWLFSAEKTDEIIKKCINLLYTEEKTEADNIKIKLLAEFNEVMLKSDSDLEEILKFYKVKSNADMTIAQLTQAIAHMAKKIKPEEMKEVF